MLFSRVFYNSFLIPFGASATERTLRRSARPATIAQVIHLCRTDWPAQRNEPVAKDGFVYRSPLPHRTLRARSLARSSAARIDLVDIRRWLSCMRLQSAKLSYERLAHGIQGLAGLLQLRPKDGTFPCIPK